MLIDLLITNWPMTYVICLVFSYTYNLPVRKKKSSLKTPSTDNFFNIEIEAWKCYI